MVLKWTCRTVRRSLAHRLAQSSSSFTVDAESNEPLKRTHYGRIAAVPAAAPTANTNAGCNFHRMRPRRARPAKAKARQECSVPENASDLGCQACRELGQACYESSLYIKTGEQRMGENRLRDISGQPVPELSRGSGFNTLRSPLVEVDSLGYKHR